MKYRKQSYLSINYEKNKAWNQLSYNTKMKYAYFISVEIMFIKESLKECINPFRH